MIKEIIKYDELSIDEIDTLDDPIHKMRASSISRYMIAFRSDKMDRLRRDRYGEYDFKFFRDILVLAFYELKIDYINDP